MKQKSSKKTAIIIVLIILVALVGFFYYESTQGPDSSSLSVQTSPNQAVGARVLSLLNQIKSLKIDGSIFKDPSYQTLQDYSVTIPPVNVGRTNPFAPLPGDVSVNPPAKKK